MADRSHLIPLGEALFKLDRLMIDHPVQVLITVDRPMLFNVEIFPNDIERPQPIATGRSVLLYEAISRAVATFNDGNNWQVIMPAPPTPDDEGHRAVGPEGTIHHF